MYRMQVINEHPVRKHDFPLAASTLCIMLINKGVCDTVLADISLNYSCISSKIVAGHKLLHACC